MSIVDKGLEAQIHNIEEQYGKSLSEWIALIKESGTTKHTDMVTMLKNQYGMSHSSAHRVALKAREADGASMVQAAKASGRDPVEEMYSGKKADLKPLHDALMTVITSFGNDIELAPKKGVCEPAAQETVRDDPTNERDAYRHRVNPQGGASD
jgi:hypothetical protein